MTRFHRTILAVTLWGLPGVGQAQNNLATTGVATASGARASGDPKLAIDGNPTTAWSIEGPDEEKWLNVELPGNTEVTRMVVKLDLAAGDAPVSYAFQNYMNGRWRDIVRRDFTGSATLTAELAEPMLVDELRIAWFGAPRVVVKEFEIHGVAYTADLSALKGVILNQSGFNLDQPKRFTVPGAPEGARFDIENTSTGQVEFTGRIHGEVGDFTAFNPATRAEFVIRVGEADSFPFRIGPYWLERVSTRNSLDFMAGARHYVGTTREIRNLSWAWRDGDFFNWALQTLVAQYLSNPEGYARLAPTIHYVANDSYPAEYQGLWGKLDPYDEAAPDVVKLIHWDADVKVSQHLEHEHQKAELAHFLYAFPHLKPWLPQQNFDVVYAYLKAVWSKPTVRETSTTKYDRSESHDLLALKTRLGTNKGELPPGASVIPNLMMFEVAKAQGEPDAGKYFAAATRQMEWMIAHLDWADPMTTKGQRMSEHITMRAFAYFLNEYPETAPAGLREKVAQWAEVAVRRANNLWDFRRYTDDAEWAPLGWNETGNILGFPAAALAAKSVLTETSTRQRLTELAWAHFDSGFGRNPLGRHSSYDGPREIEGVDLGWFHAHKGGIGLLEPVPFVFDGSPKAEHYPNHPELGNIGWTEGWVQFNVAFNVSLAYLAHDSTALELRSIDAQTWEVRLRAPINLHEDHRDEIDLELTSSRGGSLRVTLAEDGPYATTLSGKIRFKDGRLEQDGRSLPVHSGDQLTVRYGLGYMEKSATLTLP